MFFDPRISKHYICCIWDISICSPPVAPPLDQVLNLSSTLCRFFDILRLEKKIRYSFSHFVSFGIASKRQASKL